MAKPTTVVADSMGGRTQRNYGLISKAWRNGQITKAGEVDSKYLKKSVKPKSKKECKTWA
jgi:hypothetical protein